MGSFLCVGVIFKAIKDAIKTDHWIPKKTVNLFCYILMALDTVWILYFLFEFIRTYQTSTNLLKILFGIYIGLGLLSILFAVLTTLKKKLKFSNTVWRIFPSIIIVITCIWYIFLAFLFAESERQSSTAPYVVKLGWSIVTPDIHKKNIPA